nr:putative polyprotein [Tanacetum cinerariifolium]
MVPGLFYLELEGIIAYTLWMVMQWQEVRGTSYLLLMIIPGGKSDGRTVKKLRTDNGLEFCNREFKQLCIESGIARHLTVAGTPQQNGLAERMNRTLMDKRLRKRHLWRCGWDIQVEVELQRLNNHTLEEDQTDNEGQTNQDDGDNEDAGDQEIDQPPDLTDYQLVRDREPRTRTKPLRFRDESNMAAYAFAAAEEEDTHEPLTYQEVVACEDSSKWKAAMKEEMDSLRKNKTWELVDHQAGQKLRACIDYNEVFSLVVRHTSIRVILALTACKDFELEQLDVKTAFLHRNLKEVIYMRQPPGHEQDDMLIACKSNAEIGSTKSLLKREFDMKDLGEAKKILGMEIVRDQSSKILRVSQSGYVSKILNNFRIDNGKSVQMRLGGHFKLSLKDCLIRDCDVERMSKVSYANAVVSLMYLMVCTRPDIAYAISIVSRYLANPDYAKDPDKGRSITGYTFLVQGCVVSWKATLQHVLALSTTEAEYIALTEARAIHLLWNHVFHERTKHINVRYHFIREVLKAKTVEVLKVGTEHYAADALMKVVPGHKLQHCLELLSVGIG